MKNNTPLVRFNILTILAGLSFQNGAQMMIQSWSLVAGITGPAYLLLLANFYHGKIACTEDENHLEILATKPGAALADYALNILVITCFVFMPYFFNNILLFLYANLALRILDCILVFFTRNLHKPGQVETTGDALVHRAQRFWIIFNASCVILYSGLAMYLINDPQVASICAIVFGLTVVLDLVLDYSINFRMYFGSGTEHC